MFYDHLTKEVLEHVLIGTGLIEMEHEVAATDAQYIDLSYVPDPAREAERRALGLLGDMCAEACLFELFHEPPGVGEVRSCIRKQLTMHHNLVIRARREQRRPPAEPPLLWVISSGYPESVVRDFGLQPLHRWPPGFYTAAVGWRFRLVVANELPVEPQTLVLRLAGSGRVFSEAIAEIAALPEDAKERRAALPTLIELRLTIPDDPGLRSSEEQEFAMRTSSVYEEWKRKLQDEGEMQGGIHGRAAALLTILATRGFELKPEQRARIAACNDSNVLERWISRAVNAPTIDDALE